MDLASSFNAQTLGRELIAAVKGCDVARAVELLEKGAPADARDEAGNTPLMLAAENGNVVLAGLLLGSGAEVDAKNDAGKTALWLGATKREVMSLLVEFDANLLLVNDRDYRELIFAPEAARRGKEEMLRRMLDAGMTADLFSGDGESLLMIAAANAHEGMAKMLVERGADVNKKDTRNRTVLRAALKGGSAAIVRLVLDAGADTRGASEDPDTNSYYTDAGFAAMQGPEMEQAVAQAAVKFALHDAAKDGDVAKVLALLKRGVPADFYDRNGYTAIMYAADTRHAEVVKVLLAHGANPNVSKKGTDSARPLHTAVINNDLDSVIALTRGGARTDAKDSMGQDVITSAEGWLEAEDIAVRRANREEIVRVLKKRRSQEITEMARSATRLSAPTQALRRASFTKKDPAP